MYLCPAFSNNSFDDVCANLIFSLSFLETAWNAAANGESSFSK